jgi:hypothetical protein
VSVEVVGVRFSSPGPLTWYRAGAVPAAVGEWVVAEHQGRLAIGQVIVGRGQCLSFPHDFEKLPRLTRAANSVEIPHLGTGAGRTLLDSLP